MKFAIAVTVALLGLTSAQGAEYKWTDAGFVMVGDSSITIQPSKQAVVIQPGFHAHTREDGSTFIHGDENYGKAAPHAGVARPWPKTGLPGQTVVIDAPTASTAVSGASYFASGDCPNGVCPANARRFGYTVSNSVVQTASSYHSESHSERRGGPLKRIADNARERREARQANRQAGGGWFGLRRAGGCP